HTRHVIPTTSSPTTRPTTPLYTLSLHDALPILLAIHSRTDCRDRPLRSPHRHAPLAAERAVHAEALGRPAQRQRRRVVERGQRQDRKSTRLNSSHVSISYAVFCLKKKK